MTLPRANAIVSAVRVGRVCDPADVVLSAVVELMTHHDDEWSANLISGDAGADDRIVAASIQRIECSVEARVLLIAHLDEWAETNLGIHPGAAVPAKSLGVVVDRMAHTWVQTQRLSGACVADGLATRAFAQWAQLLHTYDTLALEVAGRTENSAMSMSVARTHPGCQAGDLS